MQIDPPPQGFAAAGWHIGLKINPAELDFGVIHSLFPCNAAAVFTRNNFPGWPVIVGRKHAATGRLRTVIVNSANANTATGPRGLELVYECCQTAAQALGISSQEILPASTGVIGRPLHIQKKQMLEACRSIPQKIEKPSFENFARAICTTDAYPKTKSLRLSNGVCISGIAKGAGMIEPNMATMLAFLYTDAQIAPATVKCLLSAIVNLSFNRITVDSDTSTSDTAVLLANGSSGIKITLTPRMIQEFAALSYPISKEDLQGLAGLDADSQNFIEALLEICVSLARMIVSDGEGATKLIELCVANARDSQQALKIGRSLLNSPLFKTALYGCDPNWGRIFMAIGKVFDEPVSTEQLKIYFGKQLLDPGSEAGLALVAQYLQNEKIQMRLELGQGNASETLWGCDLNENYVRLNSAYTS